ncbi:AraC family transcriptional regulator [Vallitalea guaymasensis]|uniref:Helix-turn-helix transcriptional regulator n=1 Tax=Vallitalea guaymasensis TaxID=1185412 RepID=A0A8J8SC99_9FIRM|nr:AraC family transcriptional regulator [Vallitalea guaymasensis]QUH29469.1 helix-turn-helix transcriptional regulator [Vallitalea guaymasensis]
MRKINIDSNEINPFIRRAGLQGSTGWPYTRKLYDYEMLYFIKGKGKIEIASEKSMLSSGSVLLIPPNTPSKLFITDKNSNIIWVHFDFFYVSEEEEIDYYDMYLKQQHLIRPKVFLNNGFTFPYHIVINDSEKMSSNFQELLNCYQQHSLFWQLRCKSILLEIIYSIINQVYTEESYPDVLSKERIVYDIRQYIYQYYQHKLTLGEIANYAGISNNYANRIFKEMTGETIIQHLNNYRLKKAVRIIENSNLTIEHIAESVGFANTYYFSRMMKKYTGKSPRQYRTK